MRSLWALAALLFSASAVAGTVGFHVGSVHFPARDFNNFNPGIYYRTDSNWQAGVLYNSERHVSFYGAKILQRGRFALALGAITGYERAKVVPLVAPSFAVIESPEFTARILYLPKVESTGAHALHLVVEF